MATTDRGHEQQPRTGKGKFTRSADTAERDAQACRLRTQGRTYDQIADALGFADRANARRAVERALLATVAEPAAALRTLELARLDAALMKTWAVLESEHVVVSNGRVVVDPESESGKPLRDHGPILQAVDRVIRLGERRAKLLGLDAPTRVEAVTVDQVEQEINRLAAEMGLNDPERNFR